MGKIYFNCIGRDATACCAQGLEFELSDRYVYPDDYPQPGEEITVQGTFDMYEEEHDGNSYYYLVLRTRSWSEDRASGMESCREGRSGVCHYGFRTRLLKAQTRSS